MNRVIISLFSLTLSFNILIAQGIWVKKADYPGCFTHSQIAFSVGGKGYVGLGSDSCDDIWEYNPETDTWTEKGNFPGLGRTERPVSFAIDDKGYVAIGADDFGTYSNSLWQYNHTTDTWQEKAPFPGQGRGVAVSFVIDGKAYIGAGVYYDIQGQHILSDFWKYDPQEDLWTQIADIPIPLAASVAFSAAGKGFVGSGGNQDTPQRNEFYSYDPQEDSWTQVQSVPREPTVLATAFSIGNQGYFGMGLDDSQLFFEYNPFNDEWIQKADYPDFRAWDEGIGFNIGNKGYMGLGDDMTFETPINRSFYEYTPDSIIISNVESTIISELKICMSPNPITHDNLLTLKMEGIPLRIINILTINVYDAQGHLLKTIPPNGTASLSFSVADLPKGVYFISVRSKNNQWCKKMIKT